jgi:hypothetical protein
LDTEGDVPARIEAVRREAVVPNFQRGLQERFRGRPAQRDPGPDRHVPSHPPIPDGLMAQRLDRLLFRDELQDLLGFDELLARFSYPDVDHDLLHPDLAHARHGAT